MNKIVLWLERKLAGGLLKALKTSVKLEIKGDTYKGKPCIYLFWHRNVIPMGLHRMHEQIVVLVSSSKDGELIAGPMLEMGYKTVRGSTTRHGASALKELVRLAKDHQIAITPDGPKGPPQTIQQGALFLALMAKIPIIPLQTELSKEWIVNSWDKMRIPKPFSKIRYGYGEPLWIRSKEEFESATQELQRRMQSLEMELKDNL